MFLAGYGEGMVSLMQLTIAGLPPTWSRCSA